MMRDEGLAQIGYVYTFIISSILLTAMTLMSTDMVRDAERASLRIMLTDVADHIETEIGSVVAFTIRSPNSTVEKSIKLQPLVFTFSYTISATDTVLYVNATYNEVFVLRPIMNPTGIDISGRIASSAETLIIRYDMVNGTGHIRLLY